MTTTTVRVRSLPATAALSLISCVSLAACTPWGVQPVAEQLDPVSGTTVIALAKPVQLVTRVNRGPGLDPFAFLAPFEIDRMGEHGLYLWVSTPQDQGLTRAVEVLCDGEPLALPRLEARPASLSRGPYRLVAPWSIERYFALPERALQCLAHAHIVTVVAQQPEREDLFDSDSAGLKALAGFATHHANPL